MIDERATCEPRTTGIGFGIGGLIERMERLEDRLIEGEDPRRYFHSTYLRTTRAVAHALGRGDFCDGAWVERWDVVFAGLYLDALEASMTGGDVPGPWRAAWPNERGAGASPQQPVAPLRLTLLGMNAHINFDLAQSLVAVISSDEFDDAEVRRRRNEDHRRIDAILAGRVRAEDRELQRVEPPGSRTVLDRALTPFNTAGTKRFLAESRAKVWRNAVILDDARRAGADAYARRLAELAALTERRVADLARPGQVILRLARNGFGVELEQ